MIYLDDSKDRCTDIGTHIGHWPVQYSMIRYRIHETKKNSFLHSFIVWPEPSEMQRFNTISYHIGVVWDFLNCSRLRTIFYGRTVPILGQYVPSYPVRYIPNCPVRYVANCMGDSMFGNTVHAWFHVWEPTWTLIRWLLDQLSKVIREALFLMALLCVMAHGSLSAQMAIQRLGLSHRLVKQDRLKWLRALTKISAS